MDILECLKGKPDGLLLSDVSALTNTDPDKTRKALKDLMEKGIVGGKGKSRGYRYYLMSEIVLGTKDVIRPEFKEQIPELVPMPVIDKIIEALPQPEKSENIQEIRECAVGIVKRAGTVYRLHLEREIRERYPEAKDKTIMKVVSELGEADGLSWPHWGVVEVIGHPRSG